MQRIDDLKYEFPENFPPDAQDLVKKVFQEDPSLRLGARNLEDVKNHAFFKGTVPHLHETSWPSQARARRLFQLLCMQVIACRRVASRSFHHPSMQFLVRR